MKQLDFFNLRKRSITVVLFCILSICSWGQTTTAGNKTSVIAGKGDNPVKAAYPITQSIFHQKANELNETVGTANKDAANSKFDETLALMNSHLAYLDEQMGGAGANDKTKWELQMKKAKEAYFAIIALHDDLGANKAVLADKLNEFERCIH